MDPQQQGVQQPLPSQTVSQPVETPKHFKISNLLVILLGIIIILGLIGGAYYLGVKSKSLPINTSPKISPTVTSTPTSGSVEGWNIYTDQFIVMRYPMDWKLKTDPKYPSYAQIYDPTTMTTRYQNGGSTTPVPTSYVNIITESSSETPKQYSDKKIVNNPAYTGVDSKEHAIIVNGLQAEMYMEAGEGSQGYDIVLSNGTTLVVITVSTSDINLNPISQILSSFTFLKQLNIEPGSVVQKYYNAYLTCFNKNLREASPSTDPAISCLDNSSGILTQDLYEKLQKPTDFIPVTCAQNDVPYVSYGDTNVAKDNLSATQVVYPEPYYSKGQDYPITVGLTKIQNQWKISSITCHGL